MSGKEFDSVLSGIIIVLLIIAVWKWYSSRYACGQNNMTLSCGCKPGQCRCRGMMSSSRGCSGCPGGAGCSCGCAAGQCGCPAGCACNGGDGGGREGMSDAEAVAMVTSSGPIPTPAAAVAQDYSGSVVQDMSLEADVGDSHKRWCDQMSFSGLPTGASSCSILEETGRSYGSASFVGLTQRKWCKSRMLATSAPDARVTPSYDNIHEACDIGMDELI
jgi:hypothetical protein